MNITILLSFRIWSKSEGEKLAAYFNSGSGEMAMTGSEESWERVVGAFSYRNHKRLKEETLDNRKIDRYFIIID